jgi:hypothetical protein
MKNNNYEASKSLNITASLSLKTRPTPSLRKNIISLKPDVIMHITLCYGGTCLNRHYQQTILFHTLHNIKTDANQRAIHQSKSHVIMTYVASIFNFIYS